MAEQQSTSKVQSIEQVKAKLLRTFSLIALTTSFLVFFAFSIRLVLEEETQIEQHLVSFETIAQSYYELKPVDRAPVSANVTAYFSEHAIPENIHRHGPFPIDEVSKIGAVFEGGFVVYHSSFEFNGELVPLYLTINSRAMDFGDDSWDTLMIISMLLMLFLIFVLRFSLKRMFDTLMTPISSLSQQLASNQQNDFTLPEESISELQQLTQHLNSYTQMKERVAKQEMMFAKYTSHELKTPISVILGAANLQAMKPDEDFQTKQRERILKAATGMQETVELLLNIVKKENANQALMSITVSEKDISVEKYRSMLSNEVVLHTKVADETTLNMPLPALSMIINNLLDNAIRFTSIGNIRIELSNNRIAVTDTGSGLCSSNPIEHGLGLLIVSRIAESYGWQFTLDNRQDQKGCIALLQKLDD